MEIGHKYKSEANYLELKLYKIPDQYNGKFLKIICELVKDDIFHDMLLLLILIYLIDGYV